MLKIDIKDPGKGKKRKLFAINYDTLPYKMHYFLFLGAMSCVLPYKAVFSKSRLGMTGTELAALYTTLQFAIVLTKPAIGAIVDYFNKLKLVIVSLTIIQAGSFLLLLAIPPREKYTATISTSSNEIVFVQLQHINKSLVNDNAQEVFTCFLNNTEADCYHYDVPYIVVHNDISLNTFVRNSKINCKVQHNISIGTTVDIQEICDVEEGWFVDFPWFPHSQNQSSLLNRCLESALQNISTIAFNSSLQEMPFWRCLNESMNFQFNIIDLKPTDDTVDVGKSDSLYTTYQFWIFAFITFIACIASNALFTLSDTACYECLEKTGADYGKQRLWGALSWGILAPLAGFFNDLASKGQEIPDYSPGFYFMVVLAAAEILNIWRLDLVKPNVSRSILKDLGTVFASAEFVVFEFGVFMIGLFTGFIWFYLMVYIESIGGNILVMGLVHTSQCFFGELPFMFFSGWIVTKVGHTNVLTLSFMFFALRFGCYSVIHNPWFVIPVEFTHGLTYGVFYTAMTAYGKLSARPGTEATTQAVLCSTYEGLGAGTGCVLAGIGFDKIGSHGTFRVASIVSFCVAIIYGLATLLLRLGRKRGASC